MSYTIVIGNKAYSSWSLRGWLMLDAFGLDYAERLEPMRTDAFWAMMDEIPPARLVPALLHEVDGERRVVWDSLAIAEYLAERHPDAGHWPEDAAARAWARSLAAEMHSGFPALRSSMPMNMKRRYPGRGRSDAVSGDVARLEQLWAATRARWGAGGPYLFGAGFTVADAMFAPVASRFETYDVALSDGAVAYRDALLAHPSVQKWRDAAHAEIWIEPRYQFEEGVTDPKP